MVNADALNWLASRVRVLEKEMKAMKTMKEGPMKEVKAKKGNERDEGPTRATKSGDEGRRAKEAAEEERKAAEERKTTEAAEEEKAAEEESKAKEAAEEEKAAEEERKAREAAEEERRRHLEWLKDLTAKREQEAKERATEERRRRLSEWRRLPPRLHGTVRDLYRGHFLRPGMFLESLEWSEVTLLGSNGKVYRTATDVVRVKEIHGRRVVLEDGAAVPKRTWFGWLSEPVFGRVCNPRGECTEDDETDMFLVRYA